jgi:hypothetical protein
MKWEVFFIGAAITMQSAVASAQFKDPGINDAYEAHKYRDLGTALATLQQVMESSRITRGDYIDS